MVTRDDLLGQVGQQLGVGQAAALQSLQGLIQQFTGVLLRGLQAKQGDVGGFVVGRVFAGGLAQSGGVRGDVQHIVDDLKRHPQGLTVFGQASQGLCAGANQS